MTLLPVNDATRSLGLPVRFTLFIAGVVLATVAVYTAALLTVEARHLKRQFESVHWKTVEHLATVCGEAKLSQNELTALNFFKEIKGSPHLLEAACVDPSGSVWLSGEPSPPLEPETLGTDLSLPSKKVTEIEGHERWIYTAPAKRNGRLLAAGRAAFDGTEVARGVRSLLAQTARRSMAAPLGAMGLAILLSWSAARALIRPIRGMAAGARRVAQGDWSARVPADAPGELGELAREFNSMSRQLGELDRLKDQFIHTVSHDLRNPLGAVVASTRMLRKENLPPPALPFVDVIETSVVRLEAMVGNLLDTARMREGGLNYDLRPVHLPGIVNEVARLYRPVADQSRKVLEVRVPSDLPPVLADEEKVMRVFLNLISNAFKFTRAHQRIEIHARPMETMAEVRVADTGLGIAQDRLNQLFVPFRSTNGTAGDARKGQGAGLGLSIVKALVEGQGGRLRVESTLGRGTVFTFTLPLAPPPP